MIDDSYSLYNRTTFDATDNSTIYETYATTDYKTIRSSFKTANTSTVWSTLWYP
jgi:hypothetical protein